MQTIRDATGEPGGGVAGLAISVDKITPGSCLPDALRHRTIVISGEELCEIVKGAEDFEVGIPVGTLGYIPAEVVLASLPASSTSTESEHKEKSKTRRPHLIVTTSYHEAVAPQSHSGRRFRRERHDAARVVDSLQYTSACLCRFVIH
jgi:hypothetical protein